MKKHFSRLLCYLFTLMSVVAVSTSCNRLSKEAKQIVGNYYINEISDDVPLMELRDDGTATYRTIKPEVLTISVQSKWNVKKDSLIFDIDTKNIDIEGDSSLLGNIPSHISKKLVAYDDWSITLEQNGVNYVYRRRVALDK